jgi:hypothetical protein
VLLRGDEVGSLEKDGSFTPDSTSAKYTQYFTVKREDGQWRIDQLDDGLVLLQPDFQRAYQQVALNFPAPELLAPVPDVRYLRRASNGQIATDIVSALINGPSSSLLGAVNTNFTTSMHNNTNPNQGSPDVFTVKLSGVGQISATTRRGMIEQIVRSLRGVVSGQIAIESDGAPLDPNKQRWQYSDLSPYTTLFQPTDNAKPLFVAQGTVKALAPDDPSIGGGGNGGADTAKSLTTMNGLSDCQALSGARSLDGAQLAVTCRKPGALQEMRVGRFGQGVKPVNMSAKTYTRPTFAPGGGNTGVPYELWTVENGVQVIRLVNNDGNWTPTKIDTSSLRGYGRITDFRLSGDGTRAAVVAGGKLVLVNITRSPGGVKLGNTHVLAPDLPHVVSVSWRVQTELVVVYGNDSQSISTLSTDGLYTTPQSTVNLTPPLSTIASAPGAPLVVADASGLYKVAQSGSTWSPVDVTTGRGAVPFYAG